MKFFKSKKVKPDLDQRYLDVVSNTSWQELKRGDSFDPATTNEAVVICVAVWSHPDIEALESFRATSTVVPRQVCVFNLHDLTFDEITHFMPGIQPFTQTPVIARYIEGKLVQTLEGQAARDWMK